MTQSKVSNGVAWKPDLSSEDRAKVAGLRKTMRAEAAAIRRTRDELGIHQSQAVALRRLRSEMGLSQAQAAEILGVTQSNVSKMETARDPKLAVLRKLVEARGGRLTLHAAFDDRELILPL